MAAENATMNLQLNSIPQYGAAINEISPWNPWTVQVRKHPKNTP
jgi:hypothetical protein